MEHVSATNTTVGWLQEGMVETDIKLFLFKHREDSRKAEQEASTPHWGVDSNYNDGDEYYCHDGGDYYSDVGDDSLTVMMIVVVVTTTVMLVMTHWLLWW